VVGADVKLILFDVDGTLITCGPQVRPLFARALERVYGRQGDLDGYSFSGKTDPRIVLDLMTAAGVPRADVLAALPRMQEEYLGHLERGLQRSEMALLPGVVELLEELAARHDVALGLLTGNWRRGARIKLSRFDLNRFFPFGAFGDDGVQRHELPPVALRRAADHAGRAFTAADVLIVGDSTEDVACARAHGVPCLAVSTGWTPAERLRQAGARWVVEDLPSAARALAAFAPP
jgi:phosphoglycolate phosphatase-like HAD superfamily hydrolase